MDYLAAKPNSCTLLALCVPLVQSARDELPGDSFFFLPSSCMIPCHEERVRDRNRAGIEPAEPTFRGLVSFNSSPIPVTDSLAAKPNSCTLLALCVPLVQSARDELPGNRGNRG
eukprot:gene22538-1339_t